MPKRAIWICGLFAVEMVLIMLAFQVLASVECRLTPIETACRGLRGAVVRAMCLAALIGVYLWAAPSARHGFARMARGRDGGRGWVLLHAAAFAAVFVPLFVIAPRDLNDLFGYVFPVLTAGALTAMLAGLFWLAAPRDWQRWLQGRTGTLLVIAVLAFLLPDIAALLGPLWYWDILTETTFRGVVLLMSLVADDMVMAPPFQVIGTPDFLVSVADSCSGIEGFALITAFMGIYAWLFRDTLRMGRFWGVVLPVALALSWGLNILRITLLILIGDRVSPALAQNGFHSFAGWLFFMLLAFGVLVAASRISWLRKETAAPAAPSTRLSQDDTAVKLIPFIIFMVSGVIAQTFWTAPELAYPVQAALMFGALWWGRAVLVRYAQWPDMVSVLAGLAIGIGWLAMAPEAEPASGALMALPLWAFLLWAMTRIAGTVLFVPVIEELFFRGYLQSRLDIGGWPGKALAIAVPTAAFAALHGRYLEAGIAGVIFALLVMRRGRLADAIAAHAVANALIAAVAAWRGDWGLI